MSQTCLYLLGSPYLEANSKRIEFDTRKALAMLANLVITGRAQQRDSLAALFWPENDQNGARAALRRTLSVLKAGLPEECLNITREQVIFVPGSVFWCDTQEFQNFIQLANDYPETSDPGYIDLLAEAISLYRGDFMDGFSLRDSAGFDDWQYLQAEHYRQMMTNTLENMALALCQQKNFREAIGYARRWLGFDPLREEAHRLLMICYTLAGQRNAALQQYRNCVRILDQELGVSPVEETVQLFSKILEGESLAIPERAPTGLGRNTQKSQPTSGSKQGASYRLPLVGRSRETETILGIYQNKAPKGHLLILRGEPGIGKTRLADHFVTFAKQQGARLMTARGYPGERNLAYSVFIDAFQSLVWERAIFQRIRHLPTSVLQEASRLAPQLAELISVSPENSLIDTPMARSRFFEAIRMVTGAILEGNPPGILFLDDIQQADPASLELLAYLGRRLSSHSLLILLTLSTEQTPEIFDQLNYEIQRTGAGTMINLKRLGEDDLQELVQIALPANPQQNKEITRRIYLETEGLPFFVTEYLEILIQDQQKEDAQQIASDEWPVPGNIINLLKARLSGLDDVTWQVLTAAAIIGRSFDFDTLQTIGGRSEMETLTSLELLQAKRVIDEISSGSSALPATYDFSHDKLRQFVYEQSSSVRRRLLHRRTAEALIQSDQTRRDPITQSSLIAHHFQQAGENSLAAQYFQAAGDQARITFAHRSAIQHYQASLAAGAADPPRLHEFIGDLYTRMSEYPAAITSYHTAAALSDENHQAHLNHKLGNVYQRRGEHELASGYYQAALEAVPADSLEAASIYADLAQTNRQLDQLDLSLENARRCLDLANRHNAQDLVGKAHNLLGILCRMRGELAEAANHLEFSLEIARKIDEPAGEAAALNNLALLYAEQGNYRDAILTAHDALEICQKIGDRHQEAALLNHLAELHHACQEEDESIQYLKRAVTIFSEIGADRESLSPTVWMLSDW